MNRVTTIPTLMSAAALALCVAGPAHAQNARNLPVDMRTNVNSVDFACTGVGNREENEARWNNYPVKLETVGNAGEWLAGETVTLRNGDGARISQVKCDAPWVMMRLQPGRYSATVRAPSGRMKNIDFRVPYDGMQRKLIVRFPGQSAARDTDVMLPSG